MKLGKLINDSLDLVTVENGTEITDEPIKRTEEQLLEDGYKPACETEGEGTYQWVEYPTCWVMEWQPIMPEPTEENN